MAKRRKRRVKSAAPRTPRRRRRRRAVTRARTNPHARMTKRRRRSRARRNPVSGIAGSLMAGAKGAALVLVGKVATNTLARLVPFGGTSPAIDIVKRIVIAVVLGEVGKRVLSRDHAQLLTLGGLLSPLETGVRALKVPMVTQGLSGDDDVTLALLSPGGGMGLYPSGVGMGIYPNELLSGGMNDDNSAEETFANAGWNVSSD